MFRNKGFTLIELMIVMAIVAIVIAIAVGDGGQRYQPPTKCIDGYLYEVDREDGDLEEVWSDGEQVTCDPRQPAPQVYNERRDD